MKAQCGVKGNSREWDKQTITLCSWGKCVKYAGDLFL